MSHSITFSTNTPAFPFPFPSCSQTSETILSTIASKSLQKFNNPFLLNKLISKMILHSPWEVSGSSGSWLLLSHYSIFLERSTPIRSKKPHAMLLMQFSSQPSQALLQLGMDMGSSSSQWHACWGRGGAMFRKAFAYAFPTKGDKTFDITLSCPPLFLLESRYKTSNAIVILWSWCENI